MIIRTATIDDLPQIAAVESECFPPAEAATKEEFADRLIHYANHFWLMFDEQNDNKLVAFVDGFVTNEPDLTDEMYEKASMHDERCLADDFRVNTIPSYRRRGLAGELLERAIEDARKQGRKGSGTDLQDALIHYYAKFGFQNEGVTDKSVHGDAVWNQMRLTF